MRAGQHAAEVHAEDEVPQVLVGVDEEREAVGARVVDEHVDRADRLGGRAHGRLHGRRCRRRRATVAKPSISPATSRAPSRSRSPMATVAPSAASRRAVAAPMPLAPPVTSAIRPSSRMRRRNLYSAAVPEPGTVVVLAGGTGGAKLARGLLDVAGDDLVVIANTGDDIEVHRAYVSPGSRPRDLLAGRPHRRARVGPARRHVQRDGRAARAGGRRVVQPGRPRPRHRPRARAAARRGGAPDRDGGGSRAGDGRARAGPADDRRAGAHPRPGRRRVDGLPGVHDPPRRPRAPWTASSWPASRRRGRRPRCSRRSPRPGRS